MTSKEVLSDNNHRETLSVPAGDQRAENADFDQGYSIDRAYQYADMYRVDSDQWHYWMDEAKRLETKARGRTP